MQIGIDIVKVARVRDAIRKQKKFLERVFTDDEIAYCGNKRAAYESYAARFAAKEAVIKAFGERKHGMQMKDIEVVRSVQGVPAIRLPKAVMKKFRIKKISLSVTHEQAFAVAVVVMR